jgi:hypothetical protein
MNLACTGPAHGSEEGLLITGAQGFLGTLETDIASVGNYDQVMKEMCSTPRRLRSFPQCASGGRAAGAAVFAVGPRESA